MDQKDTEFLLTQFPTESSIGNSEDMDTLEELLYSEWENKEITIKPNQLSRLTIINEQGIELEYYGIGIDIQVQDDGRTLKVWYYENK